MADTDHRVIYHAVADFRDLYVEIAKARAELKALAAEQNRLFGSQLRNFSSDLNNVSGATERHARAADADARSTSAEATALANAAKAASDAGRAADSLRGSLGRETAAVQESTRTIVENTGKLRDNIRATEDAVRATDRYAESLRSLHGLTGTGAVATASATSSTGHAGPAGALLAALAAAGASRQPAGSNTQRTDDERDRLLLASSKRTNDLLDEIADSLSSEPTSSNNGDQPWRQDLREFVDTLSNTIKQERQVDREYERRMEAAGASQQQRETMSFDEFRERTGDRRPPSRARQAFVDDANLEDATAGSAKDFLARMFDDVEKVAEAETGKAVTRVEQAAATRPAAREVSSTVPLRGPRVAEQQARDDALAARRSRLQTTAQIGTPRAPQAEDVEGELLGPESTLDMEAEEERLRRDRRNARRRELYAQRKQAQAELEAAGEVDEAAAEAERLAKDRKNAQARERRSRRKAEEGYAENNRAAAASVAPGAGGLSDLLRVMGVREDIVGNFDEFLEQQKFVGRFNALGPANQNRMVGRLQREAGAEDLRRAEEQAYREADERAKAAAKAARDARRVESGLFSSLPYDRYRTYMRQEDRNRAAGPRPRGYRELPPGPDTGTIIPGQGELAGYSNDRGFKGNTSFSLVSSRISALNDPAYQQYLRQLRELREAEQALRDGEASDPDRFGNEARVRQLMRLADVIGRVSGATERENVVNRNLAREAGSADRALSAHTAMWDSMANAVRNGSINMEDAQRLLREFERLRGPFDEIRALGSTPGAGTSLQPQPETSARMLPGWSEEVRTLIEDLGDLRKAQLAIEPPPNMKALGAGPGPRADLERYQTGRWGYAASQGPIQPYGMRWDFYKPPPPPREYLLEDPTRADVRRTRAREEANDPGRNRSFKNFGKAVGDVFRGDVRARKGDSLQDVLKDAEDVLPRLGEKFGIWTKIIIAATIAIVALIPVVAVLTAGLGSLVTLAAGAAAGLGIFAVAAVGIFKDVQQNFQDSMKTGMPVKAQYADLANAFGLLRSVYSQFKKDTEGPVLKVFTDALILIQRLIPPLVPIVRAVGTALRGAIGQLGEATEGKTFAKFLTFVRTEGARGILSLTKLVLTLGEGLTNLGLAFAPFAEFFVDKIQVAADRFSAFTASLQAGGSRAEKFSQFMGYAADVGSEVYDTFVALIDLFVHLGVALAPLGAEVLFLARSLALFVSSINPTVLTFLIGGFVNLWLAVRLFLGLSAIIRLMATFIGFMRELGVVALVQQLTAKFAQSMPAFAAALGIGAAGVSTLTAALITLGAAFIIGGLIVLLVSYLGKLSTANKDAAESAKRHADAVAALSDKLDENGGSVDKNTKKEYAKKLQETLTTDEIPLDNNAVGGKKVKFNTTIADELEKAGGDLNLANEGQLGNADAAAKTQKTLDDNLAKAKKAKADYDRDKAAYNRGENFAFALDPRNETQIRGDIARAEKAANTYREYATGTDELSKRHAQLNKIIGDGAANLVQIAGAAGLATDRFEALGVQTEKQQLLDKAISALDAYTDAVKANAKAQREAGRAELVRQRELSDLAQQIADAKRAEIDANDRLIRSQKALTKARKDAADQLVEYQRTLRDIPLDEEQASLNLEKAIDAERKARAKPGANGIDLRQAILDRKRAENSYQDTLLDDVRKGSDAKEGLSKGIEGSDTVQDALKAVRDAQTDLANATKNYNRLLQDRTYLEDQINEKFKDTLDNAKKTEQAMYDASAAFSLAATLAGFTRDQVADLKAKQDLLIRNMDLSITLNAGNVQAQLDAMATTLEAIRLMAEDPTLSVQDAYQKAILAANIKYPAATAGRHNPGKGNSQDAGYAAGGAVDGAGTGISDDIPARLSRGEHVWTANEVVAVGGHTMVQALRAAALNRKLVAGSPTGAMLRQQAEVAALYAAAGMPYKVSTFNTGALTAGLTANVLAGAVTPVAATPSVQHAPTYNTTFGDITINNPVREPSGASLYRTVRRFKQEA